MSAEGIVYLVGAGPGDPDLITLKGLEVLKKADVIVYDRLINKRLLQRAPVLCELIEAGKTPGGPRTPQRRINQILVDRAHQGKRVVRLKGGDPFVFGRGGEELLYCREAGVRCEVVPGVTSALAGPASLQIPVTHRDMAHNLAIVSGHSGELDYTLLAGLDTVIILMGRSQLAPVCRSLVEAGKPPDTPAAVVQWATTQRQQSVVADLGSLAEQVARSQLNAPIVVMIGQVVGLADADAAGQSGWQPEKRAVGSI